MAPQENHRMVLSWLSNDKCMPLLLLGTPATAHLHLGRQSPNSCDNGYQDTPRHTTS